MPTVISKVARAEAVLVAVWAGIILCIGAIAAPAAFAVLGPGEAGRFVGRILSQDAYLSVAVSAGLFLIERQRSRDAAAARTGSVFSLNIAIIFGALFCTIAGYFAVLPMMEAARSGKGGASFAVLHGVSAGFFVLKGVLVVALAWRLTRLSPAATS